MKTNLDNAINIGIKTYRAFEYAERGATSTFAFTCRSFREYIRQHNIAYSAENAAVWIRTHQHFSSQIRWKHKRVTAMLKALKVLDDIMQNGYVTTSIQPKWERMPAYVKLPMPTKQVLDEYLHTLSEVYTKDTIRPIRVNCSVFLFSLGKSGVQQLSEITTEIVKKTFETENHSSVAAQKEYRRHIENFLEFLIKTEKLPTALRYTFREFESEKIPLVHELAESAQVKFKGFLADEMCMCEAMKKYDKAAAMLKQIYKDHQYGSGMKQIIERVLCKFKNFLLVNSFLYSHEAALEWLEYLKTKLSHSEHNNYRRVILCINEIVTTGDLKTRTFSSASPKYPLADWQNVLLEEYLLYRKQEECAVSTQRTIWASCSRFFAFLNHEGIENLSEITPELLKRYHLQSKHNSTRGKNLYSSQLRLFLRYLGIKGLVPNTLELAIPCRSAPNTKVVNVLSEEQIAAIYAYRNNAESPMELRDSAIFLLGLRMGFRISDIIELKFTDISWKNRTISITQQKTGVFLKLPMPVDVGNSLYKYIHEGRPKQTDSEYIFVKRHAPFDRLNSGHSIGKHLKSAILQSCDTAPNGFHITRRTFASNLLKGGSPIPTIVSALGHSDVHSVDKYLATNEINLRKCAIGLNGIEYMGRYEL